MSKFALLLIICFLLCSCSQGQEKTFESETESATISETASETSSEFSTETTETHTTPIIAETETSTETEMHKDEIILMPISSDKTFDVMECTISDSFWKEDKEYFQNKEILTYAKEICFADEYVHSVIEEYIQNEIDSHPDIDEADVRRVLRAGTAEDIGFVSGGGYDFDGDGEEEFLICLAFDPSNVMGGGFLVYIDGSEKGSNYKVLGKGINAGAYAKVIKAGEYVFLSVAVTGGAIAYYDDIYSLESGVPEKVLNIEESHLYGYENCFFYCDIKYDDMLYPFVLCTDGVFRQLACEKISRKDFEAHMSGGKEYLDYLAENGEEILEIYTYGYYSYKLYGYDFSYSVIKYNGDYNGYQHMYANPYDGQPHVVEFTEELVHDADVWAVRGIS